MPLELHWPIRRICNVWPPYGAYAPVEGVGSGAASISGAGPAVGDGELTGAGSLS
ncbi:MAG: hypothetical protein M3Q93_06695 [Gemmatimonadota bacterium]|nr:hypothetical protein [Gemmatimonadota bacterium]